MSDFRPDFRLDFTLTESDFLEARKYAKVPGVPIGGILWILIAGLIVLLYGTPAFFNIIWPIGPSGPTTVQPLLRAWLLIAAPWVYVIGFIFLLIRIASAKAARQAWKNSHGHHLPHRAHLSDQGVTNETDILSSALTWAAITQFCESPGLLILLLSSGAMYIFPKRALPPETDLAALRQWISANINSFRLSAEEFAAQKAAAAQGSEQLLFPRLHFTCTPQDFEGAMKGEPFNLVRWAKSAAVPAFGAAAMIAMVLLLPNRGNEASSKMLGIEIAVILVVMVTAQIISQRRRWRKARHLHGPQAVDVSELGLQFISAGGVQWLGWAAIKRFRVAGKCFVFNLRDGSIRLVPKSALMTPTDVAQFQSLAQQKITRHAGFAVLPPVQS